MHCKRYYSVANYKFLIFYVMIRMCFLSMFLVMTNAAICQNLNANNLVVVRVGIGITVHRNAPSWKSDSSNL